MTLQFYLLARLLKTSKFTLCLGYLLFSFTLLLSHLQFSSVLLSCFGLIAMCMCFIQHYLFIRLQFDADVLFYLSQHKDQISPEYLANQLDHALFELKLQKSIPPQRAWSDRLQACRKIFYCHFIALAFQAVLLISIPLIQLF